MERFKEDSARFQEDYMKHCERLADKITNMSMEKASEYYEMKKKLRQQAWREKQKSIPDDPADSDWGNDDHEDMVDYILKSRALKEKVEKEKEKLTEEQKEQMMKEEMELWKQVSPKRKKKV